MSSATLREPNKIVKERQAALQALTDPEDVALLRSILAVGSSTAQRLSQELRKSEQEITRTLSILFAAGLLAEDGLEYRLTAPTRRRLASVGFALDSVIGKTLGADIGEVEHPLSHKYHIQQRIGHGATSYTFRATQSATHRDRTLKIFLPGVDYPKLDEAIKKRAQIGNEAALPEIEDAGEIRLLNSTEEPEVFQCVVLEYINNRAQTFAEFLKAQQNLNCTVFERFVEQVGGALAALEKVGLAHGDLHSGNILVLPHRPAALAHQFWVIDFIGVPSFSSLELEAPTDIQNFRGHLIQAAIIACERHPGYSARLLLGERVFRILDGLRSERYKTFGEILTDFDRATVELPRDYFNAPAPQPFQWLRVEFIPSADWLYKLFEPDTTRFDVISRFGNTWISGPRGCGKSHYLRVLEFHPEVVVQEKSDSALKDQLKVVKYDFRLAFGVLFACRLGEFKAFTPEAMGTVQFDALTQRRLKHILVLKIWSKTLQTIATGLECRDPTTNQPVIAIPSDFGDLIAFLETKLGSMPVFDDPNRINVFRQCLAACVARETSEIAVWHDPPNRPEGSLIDEKALDEFFEVLRHTFIDLVQARFYVLVDDASVGNIHFEMQKILNSLIRSVQAGHCFKVTCDKFMYTLDTADGRSIDPRNEVTYVNLGEISTKTLRESADRLSQYMARVVDRRLAAAGFGQNIQSLLGRSQDVATFLSALALPRGRKRPKEQKQSTRRPRAYYAGWNIVWSIAHGSVRTLLELVEHIFKQNAVTKETVDIPLPDQDNAVREYSRRQFNALAMIPGQIEGDPLGPKLQAVMSAIGQLSRLYLEQYDTGTDDRWYETISLERLDRANLKPLPQALLTELVKHGLLLDEGVTFSRAQFGLCQRYDLNKVFSPAFAITYRVRNHLYVSRDRFEQLLTQPDVFIAKHRKKLQYLITKRHSSTQPTLFEEEF